ncbi:LOW QUALITY PROTEIN: hypothetical protein TorRG33x02_087680 [Trema orientale]|uniref:Uncharacterized protein n=1 Tax=Trema orientale TaxID=63057 RepID=A0A2P5FBU9_TREOI|nr:LOW QUALITY PROTEIN: hypothetical protein TorRG33x02_087680 [Trema orientale]
MNYLSKFIRDPQVNLSNLIRIIIIILTNFSSIMSSYISCTFKFKYSFQNTNEKSSSLFYSPNLDGNYILEVFFDSIRCEKLPNIRM